MTPRERDPAVWAATYAAAFMRVYEGFHTASDVPHSELRVRESAARTGECVEALVCIADAAVTALHPDGTYTAPDGTVLREPVDEGPRSYPGV